MKICYYNCYFRPHKELRSVVYCNGLRYSENATSDWEFLWNKLQESTIASETNILTSALGCTTDEELLKKYLDLVFEPNSKIRRQDATYVFRAVLNNNREGTDAVLDYIVNNHTNILN